MSTKLLLSSNFNLMRIRGILSLGLGLFRLLILVFSFDVFDDDRKGPGSRRIRILFFCLHDLSVLFPSDRSEIRSWRFQHVIVQSQL